MGSKHLRIGFDVDGVLARFDQAYQDLTIEVTGRNLFTDPVPLIGAHTWDWPEAAGYTKKEMSKVWEVIKTSPDFWKNLPGAEGIADLQAVWDSLVKEDVYFVTARPGFNAKKQTEDWLFRHLFLVYPTVIISSEKGLIARAIGLDAYIDDKFQNALDVVLESPGTRSYLLHQQHNAGYDVEGITRVNSVQEMLIREQQ